MSRDDETLRKRLEDICEARNKPYVYILKEDDAMAERAKHNNTDQGVLVLD
jgi:hypothetical protein